MQRTPGSLRSNTTSRLAKLADHRPEWRTWIGLLDTTWRSLNDAGRLSLSDPAQLETSPAGSPQTAPLLHGRTLSLDADRVQHLVHQLASKSGEGNLEGGNSLRHYRPSPEEVLTLVSSAIRQDGEALAGLAAERAVNAGALAAVAHLAALPLLQSSRRQLEPLLPEYWHTGYCPICAAWPVLAERRGLDRSRRLRCGRCAADWEVPWLFCIYCGERDHEKLGSLEPDEKGEVLKVETCATCAGYLKSIATLQGFDAFDLVLEDLGTVELDLVALDRNYHRPLKRGFTLDVYLAANASCRAR